MKNPEIPTTCLLRVILMPNGEIIHMGKTIGFTNKDSVREIADDGEYGGLIIERI